MAMVRLAATNPAQKTPFLIIYFRWGEGSPHFRFEVPANHLASLFFLLMSGDLGKVTKYQHLFIPSVTHILP